MTDKALKLLARDAEDLEVISALLQDAITPICDISYQSAEKTFVMVVNRFCWGESCQPEGSEPSSPSERVKCAISVSGVHGVQVHGLDLAERGKILELLAILLQDDVMHLVFAGGSGIRLSLEKWEVRLGDFGEPWPTTHLPIHHL